MTVDKFSKILDEKLNPITTELEGLSGRVEGLEESIENSKVAPLRIIQIQNKLEKRLSTISGKLSKTSTKDDLKKMEKRLNSKFDGLFESVDELVSNTAQRVSHIEENINIPSFQPVVTN
jgi:chromosome segregation ATPase